MKVHYFPWSRFFFRFQTEIVRQLFPVHSLLLFHQKNQLKTNLPIISVQQLIILKMFHTCLPGVSVSSIRCCFEIMRPEISENVRSRRKQAKSWWNSFGLLVAIYLQNRILKKCANDYFANIYEPNVHLSVTYLLPVKPHFDKTGTVISCLSKGINRFHQRK